MAYLNPFHILAHHVREGDKIDKALLRKVKKRLLSEFELLGTSTIIVGAQEFDKHAILQFFDKLEKDKSLYQHWQVFNNKPLLAFLEEGDLNYLKRSGAMADLLEDEQLFQYIRPHIVEQFNDALYDAVRKIDIRLTRLLSQNIQQLPNKPETEAYQKTYRYLRSRIQDLDLTGKTILRPNERVLDSEIEDFLHPSFMAIMNLLADHYFKQLRNEYAIQLEKMAINLHNISKRTALAIESIEAGLELNISEETQNRLNHVLKQLQTQGGKKIPNKKAGERTSQREKRKRRKQETSIFWIIQIIIILYYLLRGF